jgi:hypothetical protein
MKTGTNLDQAKAAGIEASELRAHAEDLKAFSGRLRSLSPYARKLLLHIAELAYHGRGEQRKPDVAYLPELYECTGLGVEAMYPLLEELKQGKFIEVEDQYPFEDVRIASSTSGINVLRTIARFCEQEKIPLREVLVDLRFELLP